MAIGNLILELVEYAHLCGLIEKEDKQFSISSLMGIMEVDSIDTECESGTGTRRVSEILSDLADIACERGLIAIDTVEHRDLFDTRIMGALTPRPSEVISRFGALYEKSPTLATDYFYKLSRDSNYIRTDRVEKNITSVYHSKYGEIDITINLSKPEKDPLAIAAAKLLPQTDYPKCPLCRENEGYFGNLSKQARQNLRQMPIQLGGEHWYLQYSPYVYYNEHCILLDEKHTPMKIDRESFVRLLEFVEKFPHYFIGSNADLKIVGGSILSHNHMQGGRYEFAMERAKIDTPISFHRYPTVKAGIVKWPMSVIRLTSGDRDALVSLSDEILEGWRAYTDESAFIYAKDKNEAHNTITPIARRRGEEYEIDLVLRNNITTPEYPLGVFHPHPHRHNIKKENIGLIEVMGLAVLPARLKKELSLMREMILNKTDLATNPLTEKHKEWFMSFADSYRFTEENVDAILMDEVGKSFVGVLSDAAVFKDTADGRAHFMKFIESLIR